VTLVEVFQTLRDRGAVLYLDDGGALRYAGLSPLQDDALRAGIAEHRATLIELFTYAPEGRCVADGCYRLKIEGQNICPDHQLSVVSVGEPSEMPKSMAVAGRDTRSLLGLDDDRLVENE
jgi:hypothetical protein